MIERVHLYYSTEKGVWKYTFFACVLYTDESKFMSSFSDDVVIAAILREPKGRDVLAPLRFFTQVCKRKGSFCHSLCCPLLVECVKQQLKILRCVRCLNPKPLDWSGQLAAIYTTADFCSCALYFWMNCALKLCGLWIIAKACKVLWPGTSWVKVHCSRRWHILSKAPTEHLRIWLSSIMFYF